MAATLSRSRLRGRSTDTRGWVGARPGYSTHQRATVERAARLLAACDAAL